MQLTLTVACCCGECCGEAGECVNVYAQMLEPHMCFLPHSFTIAHTITSVSDFGLVTDSGDNLLSA